MARRTLRSPTALFSLLLIAAFAACNGANILGPANQLEVTNAVDQFQFQVSNLDNVTQGLQYTWENTGTQATIDISQAITAGSAILTIRDEEGEVVHRDDIADDNDTDTAVGVAGSWRIDVRMENVSGTFNFRVQKRT